MRQSVAAQEGWGRPGCPLLSRDAGRGSAGGRWLPAARGVSGAASAGKDRCHVQVTELTEHVADLARPAGRRGRDHLAGLALLFGLFNLAYGTWALVHGIELRRTRKTLHFAVKETEPAHVKPGLVHTPSGRPAHQ